MDPEVAAFLKRILNTIGLVLFFMGTHSTFGIMLGYAYPSNNHITAGNVVYYVWLAISLPGLIWFLKRLWKEPIDFGHNDHQRFDE